MASIVWIAADGVGDTGSAPQPVIRSPAMHQNASEYPATPSILIAHSSYCLPNVSEHQQPLPSAAAVYCSAC